MRKLIFPAMLLFATAAFAEMSKPPELASVIHADAPYGEGTYSWMMIKAYDASLWTDAPSWSMKVPFALTLHYRMHFTARELSERSVDEMQHIAPLSKSDLTFINTKLLGLFHDVKDGDTITALYTPGKGVQLFYDGKPSGKLENDALAKRFLEIWLSEKTSAPELRRQLLKGPVS